MKDKFDKLKSTERGQLKLKFAGYMAFLIVFIILALATGTFKEASNNYKNTLNKTEEEKEEVKTSYRDKQLKLINDNYQFTYTISNSTSSVVFTGKKNDNVIFGYKETNNGIVKYKIEGEKVYIINLNNEVEYDKLYDGLKKELFNLKDLFDKLNSQNAVINKQENMDIYTYENIEGYKYIITTTDETINKIEITDGSTNYLFTFEY